MANHGIRQEHIFYGAMTGRLMSRPGWDELMAPVQPNDTIVVVWPDSFGRSCGECMRNKPDLTKRIIGVVPVKQRIKVGKART